MRPSNAILAIIAVGLGCAWGLNAQIRGVPRVEPVRPITPITPMTPYQPGGISDLNLGQAPHLGPTLGVAGTPDLAGGTTSTMDQPSGPVDFAALDGEIDRQVEGGLDSLPIIEKSRAIRRTGQ